MMWIYSTRLNVHYKMPQRVHVMYLLPELKKEEKGMKVKVKVAQLRLTLQPRAYTVHGILQARILEWVAFPFSRGSSQPRDWTQVSRIAGRFFTSWATREKGIDKLYLTYILSLTCIFDCVGWPWTALVARPDSDLSPFVTPLHPNPPHPPAQCSLLWPPPATTLQGCGRRERARVLAQAQLGLLERVG